MTNTTSQIITPEQAGTLTGLLRERIKRTPQNVAYRYFINHENRWVRLTWHEMGRRVIKWQIALRSEGLQPGERVAIMLRNSVQWVAFEQAALGLGLVVVPLYVNDRPDNILYILQDTDAKVLLLEGREQWSQFSSVIDQAKGLKRVVSLHPTINEKMHPLVRAKEAWLPSDVMTSGETLETIDVDPDTLATIVYTSGTSGRPKGVMLSHYNILWNAHAGLNVVAINQDDLFLSFLPLSHMFERTAGYYLPMMAGATVAYSRSITLLAEDLGIIKPTALISVPRIFERVQGKVLAQLEQRSPLAQKLFRTAMKVGWDYFNYEQGRTEWQPMFLLWPLLKKLVADKVMDKLGGRIRFTVCGGAPLSDGVSKMFIGLGLPMIQGYGLTETSPVISCNKIEKNDPRSVGPLLKDVEAKITESGELIIRSPGVMHGYWNNQQGTDDVIKDGWFHTGDKAEIRKGMLYITGRLKDIIVLSNGEKVPPSDMELAVTQDPLFEQVMIVGEGRPYLAALLVLEPQQWQAFARQHNAAHDDPASLCCAAVEKALTKRVAAMLKDFPGYAQVRRISAQLEQWSIENEMQTPTLKLKRNKILEHQANDVARIYEGH
ncbi:Long-chain-fatty-acid--CoA ligase [hydrothermal vent metagenome]|uniref:Long-chain-fatty-acid--CoA ligase n=1 Tax=hydrothermal vent metagenome TaxID=652676 RepID=A0A3B0ZQT7_9ZZZZ